MGVAVAILAVTQEVAIGVAVAILAVTQEVGDGGRGL
jgi:hypothetical protein